MNENELASDLVARCESRAQADVVRTKLSLVRTAEDVVDRLPRSRRELYTSILASIDTQIRTCETYLNLADNYASYRRQLATEERIHRRMRESHETRELARLVLQEIANIERERNRALLSMLSTEQAQAVARAAAERQAELDNQPRYVRVAEGRRLASAHLAELRLLHGYFCGLLNKGE